MDSMGLVVALGILLLFFGAGVAVVIFAVRRYGWKSALRYGLLSILFRILINAPLHRRGEAIKTLIPLMAAGVFLWVLPNILKRRAWENEQDRGLELNESSKPEEC
jgi:hypothetical protein